MQQLRLLAIPATLVALLWVPAAGGAARAVHAALQVLPRTALTGDTVTLDAVGSRDTAGGSIVDYKWDLGSGSFTRDTSDDPNLETRFSTPGSKPVRVQVRNKDGDTAIASATVDVRLAPPSGPVGITIDGGDYATSNRTVRLSVVWPAYSLRAQFSDSKTFASSTPLATGVRWTLAASSKPVVATVYARFPGSGQPGRLYTDVIVLDRTTPVLTSATGAGGNGVRVVATDYGSGISKVQLSPTRSGGTTVTLAGPTERGVLSLKRVITAGGPTPHWVRVQSAAGTWSGWHAIR